MRTNEYVTPENMDSRSRLWLQTLRAQTAPRPKLQLEPKRAALVVIDMLEYFAAPTGRCYLPASRAILEPLGRMLASWRSAERPVIYTRHCHQGDGTLGMLGRFFSDYIRRGEPDARIVQAVEPRSGEAVIEKNTYDAFLGTEMQETLAALGVEQLLITGVLTHMCCETSARSAFCRGYEVYLPVDGMATTTEERHLGSLGSMADAVAVLTHSEEVCRLC